MERSGSSNRRPPPQAMAVPIDAVDPHNEWRSQFPPFARRRIVSKMMDTLKYLPPSGPEGLSELNKIAVRFEEEIYNAAICKDDYLQEISMKVLLIERKSANTTVPSYMAANSNMRIQSSVDTALVYSTSQPSEAGTDVQEEIYLKANHALLNEIKEINLQLIDTIVDVADDDINAAVEGLEGTVVKCTYCAVSLSPDLKLKLAPSDVSPILPLRLLVPTKYPSCSPIVLDKIPAKLAREDIEDLSAKTRLRFASSLCGHPHVMSLKDMAKTWDVAVRQVILEYAIQNGGGNFSSRYGNWENRIGA